MLMMDEVHDLLTKETIFKSTRNSSPATPFSIVLLTSGDANIDRFANTYIIFNKITHGNIISN